MHILKKFPPRQGKMGSRLGGSPNRLGNNEHSAKALWPRENHTFEGGSTIFFSFIFFSFLALFSFIIFFHHFLFIFFSFSFHFLFIPISFTLIPFHFLSFCFFFFFFHFHFLSFSFILFFLSGAQNLIFCASISFRFLLTVLK